MINYKIYGALGYVILNNKNLPNKEIMIISDMHDEDKTDCEDYKFFLIHELLEYFLKKDYKIILEEIPSKNELIGLFPSSIHVNETRKFYLKNFDKVDAFDIRLDLINLNDFDNSDKVLFYKLVKLYKYIMKITENNYKELLYKFYNFCKKYKNLLEKKSNEIPSNELFYIKENIEEILSDIIENYCMEQIYQALQNYDRIVVYCGLYHSENIIKLLNLMNFKIKEQKGVNKMIDSDRSDLCISYFDF